MADSNIKWTKLLAGAARFLPEAGWVGIVVELLTQLAASMGVTSGESKEALQHIEALHGELGKVAAAHANLRSVLDEHTELLTTSIAHVDALAGEVQSTQTAVAAMEERIATMEARSGRLVALLSVCLLLGVAAVVLLVMVLMRLHG